MSLQVFGLGDFGRLQRDGGHDEMRGLRDPSLGLPVEGGPLQPRVLQLGVLGRVQVQLWELERDSPGSLLEASVWYRHSATQTGATLY